MIRTGAGPVAVTVTIGGVTAPRHASNVQEILARAQETLDRATLEDVYLPYRPKRRTRAQVAREKGLEPLALRRRSRRAPS